MFTHERLPDWTARWAHFIKDGLDLSPDLQLDWENINCTQFSASGIEAITGHNPYEEEEWLGTFTNSIGAALEIRRRGFETLDDVIASLFPEIPLAFVWPGDVVLISSTPWDEAARVVMPHGVALADPPYFYAVNEAGMGRGDLYASTVRAFGIGHSV